MRKISIKNLFKKSKTDGRNNRNRIVLLILIIFITVFCWWEYPILFPDSVVKQFPVVPVNKAVTKTTPKTVTPIEEVKPAVKEKTQFEIEMENRKQGYEEKIFVYTPYQPPSSRDPFQKSNTSYFLEGTTVNNGDGSSTLRFPKPELPVGTKLTGIINSKDRQVAIILMDGEIFIANQNDILLDRYIVKEIKKDEVIIDYNGSFFSVKMGGEVLSDGL